MLAPALGYARRGLAVLPVWWPLPDGRCACAIGTGRQDCPSPAKHPIAALARSGVRDASRDARVIVAWWSFAPLANVAVATGPVSGLVVLDLDRGGDASLRRLEAEHGALPRTVCCITGSGGSHLWFHSREPGLRNRVRIAPGLDVRAEHGYVLAPPSLHASGRRYRWSKQAGLGRTPIAALPAWLAALLRPPPPAEPARGQRAPCDARGAARLLARLADRVQQAPPGTRNDTLNRCAFTAGRLLAAGLLREAEVRDELSLAARAAGLTTFETERTIASGLAAGKQQPWQADAH